MFLMCHVVHRKRTLRLSSVDIELPSSPGDCYFVLEWSVFVTSRNNWLMNESIRLFTSVVSRLRLRTLRMCNNQWAVDGRD